MPTKPPTADVEDENLDVSSPKHYATGLPAVLSSIWHASQQGRLTRLMCKPAGADGLDDRYRGIRQGRRVVFDLHEFGLGDGDIVDLVGEYQDVERYKMMPQNCAGSC